MISISVTVLLAGVVVVLVRSYRLSLAAALLCVVLGFSLASTGLAPMITKVIGEIAGFVSSIDV